MGNFLIVGASSGIGEACARLLSSKGHATILIARRRDRLETLAKELPSPAFCYPYDLEDTENIKKIFLFCKEKGLKLDGMVYSAGINADIPLKAFSAEMFAKVLRINCIAFAELGKYFCNRKYSNDFSRIVAISSSASQSCDKGMGMYSASKAALNALVKTMSKEFLGRGILVNAIMPAGVLTPMATEKIRVMTGAEMDVGELSRRIQNNGIKVNVDDAQPLGFILPENLSELAEFLISDANKFITGALIPVSAGRIF